MNNNEGSRKNMLHIENKKIQELLLKGKFGLEKEGLRVTADGKMSHTPHPFPGDKYVDRDFCENQTEINTPALRTAEEAWQFLDDYTSFIRKKLSELPEPEYLWPFSNPPYILNEEDVPIAQYFGEAERKTIYRKHLAEVYGRYKMTYSGIHINYSFSDELLHEDFLLSGETDPAEYKNQFYVTLAERAAAYGWLLTAVTAASPLLDLSFCEAGAEPKTVFCGLASARCSEIGYWNSFTPVFDYTDIRKYADGIQKYVDDGLIAAPTELYYPIRLKPKGLNDLKKLHDEGADHIELRMIDLNPLLKAGLDIRDLKFAQLLLVYLAASPRQSFGMSDQVHAVQNMKRAAHYDLRTVKIMMSEKDIYSAAEAGRLVIGYMKQFYRKFNIAGLEEIIQVLDFEEEKFTYPEKRYAWIVRERFGDDYLGKGLELAKKYLEE